MSADDQETGAGVVAYRLRKLEERVGELIDGSLSPAVYAVHRQTDEDRFKRIEMRQVREEELRQKQDEARRTTRLAIALAIVSPILTIVISLINPGGGA